jgi:Trafficking protein Mon1.
MYFLDTQIVIPDSELWFPICLPRLSQSAFVNCFQCCIGELFGMRLTLISQQPSLEEFKSLQSTANAIKSAFGITPKSYDNDCQEKMLTKKETKINHWRKRFLTYLSSCLKDALDDELQKEMMQNYCNMSCLIHFTFRYAVPIRHCKSRAESDGRLIQSFGPQLSVEGYNLSEKKIWIMYQRLALRLSVGTESVEDTLNMYDSICGNSVRDVDTAITRNMPSQILHETSLNDRVIDEFLYITDGDELYVAQRGRHYDFYAVLPKALSSVADAKILCSTLVETLLHKSDDLQFMSFL